MKWRTIMLCNHANEVPRGTCMCPHDCECRERMCPRLDHGTTSATIVGPSRPPRWPTWSG